MKECPNCKKVFADDLFFCLYDGVRLIETTTVSSDAPTVVDIKEPVSVVTQIIPDRTIASDNGKSRSPLYLVTGGLAVLCLVLLGAVAAMYLRPGAEADTNTNRSSAAASTTPTSSTPSAVAANSSSPTVSPSAAITPANSEVTTIGPTGKWKGRWSTPSGTLLDIEITLSREGANRLDGSILWTLRRTVRPDKMNKVGLSATEFVRGSYDPVTRTITMNGFRKDDPDDVLVMLDAYRLTLSDNGQILTGVARNGGKWNGQLRLTR